MGVHVPLRLRILRRDIDRLGFDRSFTIYDSDDSKRVIKDIIKELELEEKSFPPREVQTIISRAKNDMQTPEDFAEQGKAINDWRKIRMGKVYSLYNKKLRDANALDFDDLLWHTVRLLETAGDVREYYQRKFRYILIDEYQDTNAISSASNGSSGVRGSSGWSRTTAPPRTFWTPPTPLSATIRGARARPCGRRTAGASW